MDQRKFHSKRISNGCGPLGSSGVGRDDNSVLVVGDIVLDIPLQKRAGVEVVDGDIKEALILWVVEVHGNNVVGSGAGEEIRNQCAGLSNPLLVSGRGLENWPRGAKLRVGGGSLGAVGGWAAACEVFRGVDPAEWGGRRSVLFLAILVRNLLLAALSTFNLQLAELAGKSIVREGGVDARGGGSRARLKGVGIRADTGGFGEGSADLVVGNIRLARVGEEGHHGRNLLCGSRLAGRDGNEQLNEVVVDVAGATLDDKDILSTHRVVDFDTGLANRKLRQHDAAIGDAQHLAHAVDKDRVRGPAEDDNVADHGGGDGRREGWKSAC